MDAPAALFVTTTRQPSAVVVARAQSLALHFGRPYRARRVEPFRDAAAHESLAYVVGTARESVVDRAGNALFVEPGQFQQKLQAGRAFPLLAAIAPAHDAVPRTVLDGTLGRAHDALVIAAGLDAAVTGIEASPVLVALLEEGLRRLAHDRAAPWARAASSITPQQALVDEVLKMHTAGAFDVVFLDPMMDRPRKAADPGFAVLRQLACSASTTSATLRASARVARQRVVVKVSRGQDAPAGLPWHRRIDARAVAYLIHEKSGDLLPLDDAGPRRNVLDGLPHP